MLYSPSPSGTFSSPVRSLKMRSLARASPSTSSGSMAPLAATVAIRLTHSPSVVPLRNSAARRASCSVQAIGMTSRWSVRKPEMIPYRSSSSGRSSWRVMPSRWRPLQTGVSVTRTTLPMFSSASRASSAKCRVYAESSSSSSGSTKTTVALVRPANCEAA